MVKVFRIIRIVIVRLARAKIFDLYNSHQIFPGVLMSRLTLAIVFLLSGLFFSCGSTENHISYSLTGRTLNVMTSGRAYSDAGIRINSPGYSVHNGCSADGSGYCMFSVSSNSPTKILIDGATGGTVSFELCLDVDESAGCQTGSVSLGPALYAGTQGGNIEESWDNGATWLALTQPGGSFGNGVFSLGQTLFASGANGRIQVSTDGGSSWKSTGQAPDGSAILSIFATSVNQIYAGTSNGNLAVSSNGGASWILAAQPDGASINAVYVFENVIYVGTSNGNLAVSSNGGVSWTQTNSQPAAGASVLSIFILNDSTWYVGSNNQVVSYTTDGGNSWSNTPPTDGTPAGLTIANSTLYVGTQNGFFQSMPLAGSAWTSQSLPDSAPISSVTFSGSTFYAGTDSGNVFKSSDGVNWTSVTQPGGNLNYGLAKSSDGKLYVGGANGFVYVSSDAGQSWLPTQGNAGLQAQVEGIYLQGSTIYAATWNQGVAISTDGGQSWNSSQFGISTSAIAGNGGNTIYESQGAQVFYTTNNGNTWSVTAANPDGSTVNALLLTNSGLFAGTSNGNVLISSNNGSTWTALTQPDGSAIQSLAQYGSSLYAGTASGKFAISTDAGATWTFTGTTPDGTAVLSVVVQ